MTSFVLSIHCHREQRTAYQVRCPSRGQTRTFLLSLSVSVEYGKSNPSLSHIPAGAGINGYLRIKGGESEFSIHILSPNRTERVRTDHCRSLFAIIRDDSFSNAIIKQIQGELHLQ